MESKAKFRKRSFLIATVLATLFCIYTKYGFTHYNLFFHLFVIFILTIVTIRKKSALDPLFKKTFVILIILNVIVISIDDHFVYRTQTVDVIPYSEEDFDWSYFQKRPQFEKKENDFAALIHTGIHIRINTCLNYTSAIAIAVTNPRKNYHYEESDYTLRHELYHFKIAELFARQINYYFKINHFVMRYEIEQVIKKYTQLKAKLDAQYDLQTNHSINTQEQIRWEKKIDQLLNTFNR